MGGGDVQVEEGRAQNADVDTSVHAGGRWGRQDQKAAPMLPLQLQEHSLPDMSKAHIVGSSSLKDGTHYLKTIVVDQAGCCSIRILSKYTGLMQQALPAKQYNARSV